MTQQKVQAPELDLQVLRKNSRLLITDKFEAPPIVMSVDDSIISTLGNFSASTGKAKSRKTFNICAMVASALTNGTCLNYKSSFPKSKNRVLYVDTEQSSFHCMRVLNRIFHLANLSSDKHIDNLEFLALRRYAPNQRLSIIDYAINNTANLGLVVIDGIRDLVHDINSPSESTAISTYLMKWTDEHLIHIHTVLHQNKSDDNTRGHLGTELNNKAETIIQVAKDDLDSSISYVEAKCIRHIDFEPFAFKINGYEVPELIENYISLKSAPTKKGFDYNELTEAEHRKALELLSADSERIGYGELIDKLKESYTKAGFNFGISKTKELKRFLENKRMIVKEGKSYTYNPNFYY